MTPIRHGRCPARPVLSALALAALGAAPPPSPAPPPKAPSADARTPTPATRGETPLASWLESPAKRNLAKYLRLLPQVRTGEVPFPDEVRISLCATEGVLWDEGPVPLETAWALDRLRALAPSRPEWRSTPPFSGLVGGGSGPVARLAPDELAQVNAAALAGLDADTIRREVLAWVRSGHPSRPGPADLGRPPMRELLELLRSWGFRNYVVSDGPAEVTRALVEALYGLPSYRVVAPASPFEVRASDDATRLVHSGATASPGTAESRLLSVARQIGMRPLIVAAVPARDTPIFRWAAGRTELFLAIAFPGPSVPGESYTPPGARAILATVSPATAWVTAAGGPDPRRD